MLDGYLCGVLVQPVLLEPATWLPHVFDFEGQPLPDDVDAAWLERTHRADPAPPRRAEPRDDRRRLVRPAGARVRRRAPAGAADPRRPRRRWPAEPDLAGADAVGRAASSTPPICFPDLAEMPDDAVMAALARLYRHLPAETDEEREVVATLDREQPLATLDDAIEDLVVTVADLSDLTRDAALQGRHRQARRAQGRPQRPVPVRQRQEVQALPRRRLMSRCGCKCSPTCTSRPRPTSPSRRRAPSCWCSPATSTARWAGLERFRGWPVPVLFVAGNHEFDGRELDDAWPALRERCARLASRCSSARRIVLTDARRPADPFRRAPTRWSDFDLFGPAQPRTRACAPRATSWT